MGSPHQVAGFPARPSATAGFRRQRFRGGDANDRLRAAVLRGAMTGLWSPAGSGACTGSCPTNVGQPGTERVFAPSTGVLTVPAAPDRSAVVDGGFDFTVADPGKGVDRQTRALPSDDHDTVYRFPQHVATEESTAGPGSDGVTGDGRSVDGRERTHGPTSAAPPAISARYRSEHQRAHIADAHRPGPSIPAPAGKTGAGGIHDQPPPAPQPRPDQRTATRPPLTRPPPAPPMPANPPDTVAPSSPPSARYSPASMTTHRRDAGVEFTGAEPIAATHLPHRRRRHPKRRRLPRHPRRRPHPPYRSDRAPRRPTPRAKTERALAPIPGIHIA